MPTICVILSDFVGQYLMEEQNAMVEPVRVDSVSRRTVLKGMAGAAGLISIPAIIAACSTPAATTAPSEAAPSVAAPSVAAPSEAARGSSGVC